MKKILFLHGFYASGQCVPALALREAFAGRVEVLTPDLPLHPDEALALVRDLCRREHPDMLVGNSCGSFYAQMVACELQLPALLGNPHFRMSEFLRPRLGQQQYKSPRQDGRQQFVIDEALIAEFTELEQVQFAKCSPLMRDRVWGIFGEQDTLAHFEPLFLEHYARAFHFPGNHTPTAVEVRDWHVPLIEQMLSMLDSSFEQRLHDDLFRFLLSRGEVDQRLPSCPDVEAKWESVASAYAPDGIREFQAYPVASLGWMMYVGMAIAQYWDDDWEVYSRVPDLYAHLRDKRGYDYLDEYVLGELLQLEGSDYSQLEQLASECASRTYSLLRHENIEPGTRDAFLAYIASLHQLYLMGVAVQLRRMGYHMTKLG